jgi:hypothetical protein
MENWGLSASGKKAFETWPKPMKERAKSPAVTATVTILRLRQIVRKER